MPIDENRVAVCLPTYNEAENVEYMVSSIREVFNGLLFIVDGFSTDDTVLIAQKNHVSVYFRCNQGKGSAMQKAIEVADEAGKEFVLFMDCDRSNKISDILLILNSSRDVDLVLGDREINNFKPISRLLGNLFVTWMINIFHFSNIRDSLTGIKLIRVKKFKGLIVENSFLIDPLICIEALRRKMRIEQVNVEDLGRNGKSKMTIIKGLILLPGFIKILLRLK